MSKNVFYGLFNPKPIPKGTDFTNHEEVCNQLAKEHCEINKILHQFEKGEISNLPVVREAQYDDMAITPQSFEQAEQLIKKVKNDYNSLPSHLKKEFGSLKNYVADINKIAIGDAKTLAKYKNFKVTSPQNSGADVGTSGNTSSSISRSDSGIGLTNLKASNNNSSAEI